MNENEQKPEMTILPDPNICEMGLCEVGHIFLKPNQLYRFVVIEGCKKCAALAHIALGNETTNEDPETH